MQCRFVPRMRCSTRDDEFVSTSLTRAWPDDVLDGDSDRGDAHQQDGMSDASSLGLYDAA